MRKICLVSAVPNSASGAVATAPGPTPDTGNSATRTPGAENGTNTVETPLLRLPREDRPRDGRYLAVVMNSPLKGRRGGPTQVPHAI